MSPTRDNFISVAQGFPRVSGDEPESNADNTLDFVFSPRERG